MEIPLLSIVATENVIHKPPRVKKKKKFKKIEMKAKYKLNS